jgi:hypothetical protein
MDSETVCLFRFSASVPCLRHSVVLGPLSDRLATFLREREGGRWCFSCLADTLDAPQSDLRDVAQILMLRHGFTVREQICSRCRRMNQLLTFLSDAPALCALCRKPILPEPSITTAEGLPYHGRCWDRRIR